MRTATSNLWIEDGDAPRGDIHNGTVELHLDSGRFTQAALVGPLEARTAWYLRRLAVTAEILAAAVETRLAESTAGETRDVPTPGAAT